MRYLLQLFISLIGLVSKKWFLVWTKNFVSKRLSCHTVTKWLKGTFLKMFYLSYICYKIKIINTICYRVLKTPPKALFSTKGLKEFGVQKVSHYLS